MGAVLSKTGHRTKIGQKFKGAASYQNDFGENSVQETPYLEKENAWGKEVEDLFIMRKNTEIHLYLCRYKIFLIDSDIRYFRSLKILQICCNYLTSLPSEIGELSSLVVLFVARNKLTSVPESLARLPHLKELNLSDNRLESLPNAFRFFQSLESIDLTGNPISELPLSIPHISSLRSISVQRTKIRYFSPDLLRLVFLTDISVNPKADVSAILQGIDIQECSVQSLQNSLIVRRRSPVPLYEKAAQKIITDTRLLRKSMPTPILKMFLDVKVCDLCGSPLFTSFITVFTDALICDKEVLLRFLLCKAHPLDYSNPFHSLRESLFREKEYMGDSTIPSIPFMFDSAMHTKEQRKIIRMHEKKLNDTASSEVHLLLLKKLLQRDNLHL
ncbi:hypothetical protein NECID01_1937 [Nematocida sp. AWRm77]|nr:hypothetical protein NECID01_1937 [Nematocida sp. AWRm77]